jgi:hypothetical protein
MRKLTKKAQDFLSKKPYFLGNVMGNAYYEHPTQGDEGKMMCITIDGRLKHSAFWDIESVRQFGNEFGRRYQIK